MIEAVKDCVNQAGGNVEALMNVEIVKTAGALVSKTVDVVIIGGGGAGLSAATAAAENGATVVVIEKPLRWAATQSSPWGC